MLGSGLPIGHLLLGACSWLVFGGALSLGFSRSGLQPTGLRRFHGFSSNCSRGNPPPLTG
ncbi:MAG: hypothetical protein ACTSU5_06260 [Promethearchaeota archaeon]